MLSFIHQLFVARTVTQRIREQLKEGGKKKRNESSGVESLGATWSADQTISNRTLSSLCGTVWTGIGCHFKSGVNTCWPLGG